MFICDLYKLTYGENCLGKEKFVINPGDDGQSNILAAQQ